MITTAAFGKTKDNQDITVYTLSTDILKVEVTNFGATIKSIVLDDFQGVPTDVVLGFDTLAEYEVNDPYLGVTVGRCCNRISNGQFDLDGVSYQIPINNGQNSLHGGIVGFSHKVWNAEVISEQAVKMTYTSVDGEEGYPGTLETSVTFSLVNDRLELTYSATTDKKTIVNLTNHSYFNLSGGGSILGQLLEINCDTYTPLTANLVTTGEVLPVKGTSLDFTTMKTIGEDIESGETQLKIGKGYDHGFCHDGNYSKIAASAFSKETGIKLDLFTTEPIVHLYTGNYLAGIVAKGGVTLDDCAGFCLETQHHTDAINRPEFPTTILKPGQVLESKTTFKISI